MTAVLSLNTILMPIIDCVPFYVLCPIYMRTHKGKFYFILFHFFYTDIFVLNKEIINKNSE